jgi:23S rRNA (cytidine1920-2'-O)/16S rRNA (cytidine1409-2'-O)-methyltransferase
LPKKEKEQLDKLLVKKGLARNMSHAHALIMSGNVVVEDHRIDKPGTLITRDSHVRLKQPPAAYVSRGGIKLEKVLERFSISVQGKIVLDVGASTGGFTDCLLQKGALTVYAVDVGYGQLAWKLQKDARVINLERKNVRLITQNDLKSPPALAVIDVSFTSLKRIWPYVITLIRPGGELLSLIKPQFEIHKAMVDKGGIIRDKKKYQKVLKSIIESALGFSLHVVGIMESPISGQKGNREFFLYTVLRK